MNQQKKLIELQEYARQHFAARPGLSHGALLWLVGGCALVVGVLLEMVRR